MPLKLAVALALAAVAAAGPGQAQETTLREVLARAAIYVEDFRQQLSGIVAEETYVQEEIPGGERMTRSDLLLVRSAIFPRWLQYRDTFEVDGQPVRDRGDRLTALFLDADGDARQQAQTIARESTRYNLGDVIRTINVPLMPLVILERDVQPRFRFSRGADREAPRVADDDEAAGHFRIRTEVWVVRFEERERPTIIRDGINRRDVPATGRFWIEPATGRVLMSEMRAEHPRIRAEVTVSYQSEPLFDLLVPAAMHERYTNLRLVRRVGRRAAPEAAWDRIEATATYGRFRQFQVQVDERIDVPNDDERRTTNDDERRTPNDDERRTPNDR